jgi:hypothetical protein
LPEPGSGSLPAAKIDLPYIADTQDIKFAVTAAKILKGGHDMDTLAIAGLAMSMQTAQLQQMAAMQVMKMSMDSTQQSAQAITEMMQINTQLMENSVQPYLGSTIDVLA